MRSRTTLTLCLSFLSLALGGCDAGAPSAGPAGAVGADALNPGTLDPGGRPDAVAVVDSADGLAAELPQWEPPYGSVVAPEDVGGAPEDVGGAPEDVGGAPDSAGDLDQLSGEDLASYDAAGEDASGPDAWEPPPPPSPTCDATAKTGDYCGGDKVSDGSPDTLYACAGPGPAGVVEDCALGCVVAPPGFDDYCAEPKATCDANAKTGDYCGGDKVSSGDPDTLYACKGPGPAKVVLACAEGCVVAPAGVDDYCNVSPADCPHKSLLKWGLCPDASDHLRCAGVKASSITQTIGSAAASAGTHQQDGKIGGQPYCAATDLSVSGKTKSQIYKLVSALTDQGFAAYYRNPGKDGWPASEAPHIHAIYAGVKMKSALKAQVKDWLAGKNGLANHGPYTFFKPSKAQKDLIAGLFYASN